MGGKGEEVEAPWTCRVCSVARGGPVQRAVVWGTTPLLAEAAVLFPCAFPLLEMSKETLLR